MRAPIFFSLPCMVLCSLYCSPIEGTESLPPTITIPYIPFSLMVHELGHALTAKALYNAPIEIHLFPEESITQTNRFLTIGKPRLVHLFFPACARIQPPKKKEASFKNNLKDIAILAAGPLAEFMALGICSKILSLYYADTDQFVVRMALGISINFLPIRTKTLSSDGAQILDKIKKMIHNHQHKTVEHSKPVACPS